MSFSLAAQDYATGLWYFGSREWEKAAEAFDAGVASARQPIPAWERELLDGLRAFGYDITRVA